jgi:hypothetical protein
MQVSERVTDTKIENEIISSPLPVLQVNVPDYPLFTKRKPGFS